MGLSERSGSSLDTIAGHAEHVCSVAEGATPPPGIEAVSSSWQRSAKKYGLDPIDSKAPRILTPAELKYFREPLDKLIFSAQEEMDELSRVVREAGYTVLLCDSSASQSRIAVKMRGQASPNIGNLARRGVVRGGGGHKRHRHLHRRRAACHRSQKPAF